MSRRKKKGGRILLGLLMLIIVVVGAGIWYVTPTKNLDLKYRSIDTKGKIMSMLETRQPQMVLNKDEVAQMSKKNLIKYLSTHDVGVDITGADFQMNGEMMKAEVNGKWGVFPFGATLQFHMTSNGSKLILEHQFTKIRSADIPLSIFKLEPIEISLKDYLPDIVTVKEVDFLEEGMKLTFKIDWFSIPSLW
ncbi:hypothetical protein MNQ98_25790 [Paenibacillus sp. N3/727]|uniref:hypothetical protein n=1 Tax=Paenibacillus sp. N3/727 TaxID=2925845 RepID=UPI001F53801E|nr:hypothetical protein [Paenibacillus sp. N3/727]UNK17807.1 hypothetical protein MNQ98_25790 [Paenibacillus sp. N3/727]